MLRTTEHGISTVVVNDPQSPLAAGQGSAICERDGGEGDSQRHSRGMKFFENYSVILSEMLRMSSFCHLIEQELGSRSLYMLERRASIGRFQVAVSAAHKPRPH